MGYDVDRAPATFTAKRARQHTRRMFLAFATAMCLLAAVLYAAFGLGSSVFTLAALGAMYAVRRVFYAREELSRRWTLGANAEKAVGSILDELRHLGYIVMHDVRHPGEGNIDHLVSGPTGVYLIETKARWYPRDALRKARRQAAKLHDALGVWVTPVICVASRESSPHRHDRVWIVPRKHITGWIRAQRNAPVEFERLAKFADRLVDD